MDPPFSAYKGDGPFVFVSYSHDDSDLVFPEIEWLRDQGFNIWYDEGIQPGKEWRAALSESIKQTGLFLFFVSPNSLASNHCLGEVDLAVDHDKSIITVHLEKTVLPSGVDLTLSRIQAILRYEMSETVYREKLIAGISNHLQRGVAGASKQERPVIRVGARTIVAAATIVAIGLVTAAIVVQPEQSPALPQRQAAKFTVEFPGAHLPPFGQPGIAISRDGRSLAYSSDGMLHLRRLDEFDGSPLDGTQGAFGPFFSPDGKWLGFTQDESLKRYSVDTGAIANVVEATGTNFVSHWSDDDSIVFAPVGNLGIFRVAAAGGEPEQITRVDNEQIENTHMWPQLLPGGEKLLFTVLGPSGGWVDAKIVVVDLESQQRKTILEKASMAKYLNSGHLVYAQATGNIIAAPFDLDRLEFIGPAVPIQSGVMLSVWGAGASFDVSESGTLIYVQGNMLQGMFLEQISRDGVRTPIGGATYGNYIRVSPDGERLALTVRGVNNDDIYLVQLDSGDRQRFTFDTAEDESPIWSPDGDQIVYTSAWAGESRRIYIKPSDGSAEARLVYTHKGHVHATDWSPDRRWILLDRLPQWGVEALDIESGEIISVATAPETQNSDAHFSPDGRWVTFNSNESGKSEVYVVSFPDGSVKHQVSTGGGLAPRWVSDGAIYYWRGDALMKVTVDTSKSFVTREHVTVLRDPRMSKATIANFPGYDVNPKSGDVLLMLESTEHAPKIMNLIENWMAEFPSLGNSVQPGLTTGT